MRSTSKKIIAGSCMLIALLACGATKPPASVSPTTLASVISVARDASVITLPAGNYDKLIVRDKNFQKGIVINANNATFKSIDIINSRGISIIGGTISGSPAGTEGAGTGVNIRTSQRIVIQNMRFIRLQFGIYFLKSQDIVIKNNQFLQLREDGIRVAQSQRVLIDGNTCRDFTPRPAVYDSTGKIVGVYDHADCIQGWSRADYAPTSDVTVTNNQIYGIMQGIFFADGSSANNAANGGFARIFIKNNRMEVGFWNGITIDSTRDGLVMQNFVRGIPGVVQVVGTRRTPIQPWIRVQNSPGAVVCNNNVLGRSAVNTDYFTYGCDPKDVQRKSYGMK